MTSGPVEFGVLGPIEMLAGGRSFPVGQPRQREILAALLVDAGRVMSMDALVERLWGASPPRQARRSLQAHIARIRRAIGVAAGAVGASAVSLPVRDSGGYSMLTAGSDQLDLSRFRALVAQARAADVGDHRRLRMLTEARELWRGEPLAGMESAWATRIRWALHREHVDATVAWAYAELAAGDANVVPGPLTDLAELHPGSESIAVALMRALYITGRLADALVWFERIRAWLRQEFGADPSPELAATHRAVLMHDPELFNVSG